MKQIFLAFLILLMAGMGHAATYYVQPTEPYDNAGDGLSPESAEDTIAAGIAHCTSDGDILRLMPGTYDKTTQNAGTDFRIAYSTNRSITIMADSTPVALLFSYGSASYGVYLSCNGVTVNWVNIIFDGLNSGGSKMNWGVFTEDEAGTTNSNMVLTFTGCTWQNFASSGLYILDIDKLICTNCTTKHTNTTWDIRLSGYLNKVLIDGCNLSQTSGSSTPSAGCIGVYTGVSVIENIEIRDCDLTGYGSHGNGLTIPSIYSQNVKSVDIVRTNISAGGRPVHIGVEYQDTSQLVWLPVTTATFTIADGTFVDNKLTLSAASFQANSAVRLTTTGTLPSPLAINTTYYIRDVSGSTCKLALTAGGSAIDITDAGTGTHTASLYYAIGDIYWNDGGIFYCTANHVPDAAEGTLVNQPPGGTSWQTVWRRLNGPSVVIEDCTITQTEADQHSVFLGLNCGISTDGKGSGCKIVNTTTSGGNWGFVDKTGIGCLFVNCFANDAVGYGVYSSDGAVLKNCSAYCSTACLVFGPMNDGDDYSYNGFVENCIFYANGNSSLCITDNTDNADRRWRFNNNIYYKTGTGNWFTLNGGIASLTALKTYWQTGTVFYTENDLNSIDTNPGIDANGYSSMYPNYGRQNPNRSTDKSTSFGSGGSVFGN